MLYTIDLSDTIIVEDPIEFCVNKEKNALKILSDKFNGRNYSGHFIVEVLGIKRISRTAILPSNLSANGRTDVIFTALINVIDPYIANMKVYRTDPRITCASEDRTIVIGLSQIEEHKVIQKGQSIPVRISIPQYVPFKKTITATGSLLHCDTTYVVYKTNGVLTQKHAKDLMFQVNSLKKELELRLASEHTKVINFFELIFYSYTNRAKNTITIKSNNFPDWNGPDMIKPQSDELNILDLIKDASESTDGIEVTGFWSRPLHIYRSSPLITFQKEYEGDFVDQPPNVVFANLLSTLSIIKVIREMSDYFNTQEKLAEQKNIWKVINSHQIN